MFKFLKEKIKGLIKRSKGEIEETEIEKETGKAEVEKSVKEIPEKPAEEEKTIEKVEETAKERETIKTIEEKAKEEIVKVEAKEPICEPSETERKQIGLIEKITKKELRDEDVEKFLEDLRITLLKCDVAFDVVEKICEDVKKSLIGRIVKRSDVERVVSEALKESILKIFDVPKINLEEIITNARKDERVPTIIFLGFNGTGKTTTLAKVAYWLKKRGFTPILAAGDTFRAASIEQLEIHGKNLGLEVIKHRYGADSAAVIYDAREHAKKIPNSVVLADTAGRSHSNENLMDELRKICRVNKPDLKILVLDSLTGNDVVEQARRFNDAVGVDAIIMTKADVYEKGGAAISAVFAIRKPILFLGVGQSYEDLEEFDKDKLLREIFE